MKKVLFTFLVFFAISTSGYCGYYYISATSTNGNNTHSDSGSKSINTSGTFYLSADAYSNGHGWYGGIANVSTRIVNDNVTKASLSFYAILGDYISRTEKYTGFIDDWFWSYSVVTHEVGYRSLIGVSLRW